MVGIRPPPYPRYAPPELARAGRVARSLARTCQAEQRLDAVRPELEIALVRRSRRGGLARREQRRPEQLAVRRQGRRADGRVAVLRGGALLEKCRRGGAFPGARGEDSVEPIRQHARP